MKKVLFTFTVLTLTIALFAFALNAPLQKLLFFNIDGSLKSATNVSAEMANILNLSVLNDLDPETNVPDISTRFDYNFYPNFPIYAVEMSVIASKYLGIEENVLKEYPLKAPTFSDIESVLTQKYQNKDYDFSRDFGYFEYVNDYIKKTIGYSLFDKEIQPLTQLTKAEVIKALVRLFAAKTKDDTLVKLAEELSKRFSSNKNSGIVNPKDVGYISVFEQHFFKEENGKLMPLIDLPIFTKNNELEPNVLAPRWWSIALSTMIYFETGIPTSSDVLVPVRTFNNFITYVPRKSLGYKIFALSLPRMTADVVKSIPANSTQPEVFAVKTKSGKDFVGLDNTKVTVKRTVTYPNNKKTSSLECYDGRNFVAYFNSLADQPKTLKEESKIQTGKLVTENGKYYVEFPGSKEVLLPQNSTVKIVELTVGKVSDLDKLYSTSDLDTLTKSSNGEIEIISSTSEKISAISQNLKGIEVRIPTKKIEYSNENESKLDFKGAEVTYYPVVDRLNLRRNVATLGSIEKFNNIYKDGYSIDKSILGNDFVSYWKNVEEGLKKLGAASTSVVSGDVIFEINKKINTGITWKYEPAKMTIWEVYVGKLVSFEPATTRMFTQAFVTPLKYSSNVRAYITFKDGHSKYYPEFQKAVNDLYMNQNGARVLRSIVLWIQFTSKMENGKTQYYVDYIIGREI